ncbi:MAG: efflux RND transporter periplasmic adaptor subunit [Hyphomicrobiales bacterium]|nr:efflux RND transporter periplasmic adaptor subunit [Hyphomicrobiales bacterium]
MRNRTDSYSTVLMSILTTGKHMTQTLLLIITVGVSIYGYSSSFAQQLEQLAPDQFKLNSDIPIRGIVKASARTEISTELSARVTKIGFKEGQSFQKGDLLIAFDCRRLNAKLDSQKALLREFAISLRSALFLKKRNAGNRHDVDIAHAKVAKAKADVESIQIRLGECNIYAPFKGRVAGLNIHEHEIPATAKTLVSIVSMQEPEIEIVIPSSWLSWLKQGSRFNFSIDETGKIYRGQVIRPSAVVSTVSHTIKIFAKFSSQSEEVLPGMSGTVEFEKWLIRM